MNENTSSQLEVAAQEQAQARFAMIELDHTVFRLGWWMERGKNYILDRVHAEEQNDQEKVFIYRELTRLCLERAQEMAHTGEEILERVQLLPRINKLALQEGRDIFRDTLALDIDKIK